ncbi:hypothetical protein [Paenibacillus pinistramenti]|uniref:hypothetical protein n=1 Tax=Paenibacillus pinistramenti TaxID=1768003 RepID=UPI00110886B5|nr:hypothetical protein [Paenibacillus pinistramenti]
MNRRNTRKTHQRGFVQGTGISGKVVIERVLAPTLGPGEDTAGTVILKRKADYKRPAILS